MSTGNPLDLSNQQFAVASNITTDTPVHLFSDDVETDAAQHRRFTIRRNLNRRLDVYLQQRLKGISRSRIQKLIDRGGVTVNEQVPKHSTVIRRGDVIDVILPPQAIRNILPQPIPLDILYEDDWIIVINKQAGLIVHPARSHLSGTLLNGLAYRFHHKQSQSGQTEIVRSTRGFAAYDQPKPNDHTKQSGVIHGLSSVGVNEFRPGIIHRLDKNTTGVLVVAKNDEGHWAIARQFENRSTLKAYLAVVHGNFDSLGGVIEEPIGKHPTIREAMAIRHGSNGKPSITLYRVREQYAGYSLVELELKSGRTHQIRVHLSYLGHPVVGDILYGGEAVGELELDAPPTVAGSRQYLTYARNKNEGQRTEMNAMARDDLIIAHPALHAALLQFTHPATHQPVTFTAPLHEPTQTLVRSLRHRRIDRPVAKEGFWIDLTKAISETLSQTD